MEQTKNSNNSTHSVYEGLKKEITSGAYPPMAPLVETEIAEAYNVSRNTVKKALLMLESEHLITMIPNKGATVRSYSLQEILDLLEVRATLEKLAMELTVPILSDQQQEQIKNLYSQMEQKIEEQDLLQYSQLNRAFHQIIYDACPNQSLSRLIENIKTQLSKYNTKTVLIPGRSDASLAEHQKLMAAIFRKDAETAGNLSYLHVLSVREVFEKNYPLLI